MSNFGDNCPNFSEPKRIKEKITVKRRRVFWLVKFMWLPGELDDIPMSDRPAMDGDIVYGFYADPLSGDGFIINSYLFKVTNRYFNPSIYRSREPKQMGILHARLVSKPLEIIGD